MQERSLKKQEVEEKRGKAKRRMLGNIRFIGELYKKNMLKPDIMHECIQKLLGYAEDEEAAKSGDHKLVKIVQSYDEESLEALCKLLTTVGQQLTEVTKGGPGPEGKPIRAPRHHNQNMNFYFEKLRELSMDKKLPARARFMVRDLLDLKNDNWVPRRKEAKATKTEEYRKEIGELTGSLGPGPGARGPPPPGGPGGRGMGGPGPMLRGPMGGPPSMGAKEPSPGGMRRGMGEGRGGGPRGPPGPFRQVHTSINAELLVALIIMAVVVTDDDLCVVAMDFNREDQSHHIGVQKEEEVREHYHHLEGA